jgi:putative zinc finger/helix-turn-helix YgiT family protein
MVEPARKNCECDLEARQATKEEPYRFTESGLSNVYLSGVRYFVCPKCGKQSAEIPAVKRLLNLIARTIVERETRLGGQEIRFLRKRLGKKASDFAQIIGVTPEQVSRWENDANPPEASADKLIRVYYAMLSGDSQLRKRFAHDMESEFEKWLVSMSGRKQLLRIDAVPNRRTWKIKPDAA